MGNAIITNRPNNIITFISEAKLLMEMEAKDQEGKDLKGSHAVTLDHQGNLLVIDTHGHRVITFG